MYDELKKNKKIVLITLLASILCVVGISLMFIFTYTGVIFEKGSSKEVFGYSGLKEREAYINDTVGGEITPEKLNSIIHIYKNNNEEKAFQISNEKYPELSLLLAYAYAEPGDEDYFDFAKLDSADDFYKQYQNKTKKLLDAGIKYDLSLNEENYVLSQHIDVPFQYAFTDHWVIFKNVYYFMAIMLIAISSIVTAKVYSQEKETEMNKIFCSVSDIELNRLGNNKYIFTIGLMSLIYLIALSLASIIILLPFGNTGWNIPIQAVFDYAPSFFNWTMKEYFISLAVGGWILLMGFASLQCLISAYIQNSFTTIVVNLAIAYLPVLFGKIVPSSIFRHITMLHPLSICNTDSFIKSYFSYGFASYRLNVFYTAIILELIFGFLSLLFLTRTFRKRIIL